MQDLQTVSSDILTTDVLTTDVLTTVLLLLHFCECIIHFTDKCMCLHSQSVLTLVLLGAQKSNMEVGKTWLCSFVSTGCYYLEKVTPRTEVFKMLANYHKYKVQSKTSLTIYSWPTFKWIL